MNYKALLWLIILLPFAIVFFGGMAITESAKYWSAKVGKRFNRTP